MSGHTPGPWSYLGGVVYAEQPQTVPVAEVISARPTADGHLIAAAPGLLTVAEEIADDPRVDLVDSERRIRLYAAIAKARGESA